MISEVLKGGTKYWETCGFSRWGHFIGGVDSLTCATGETLKIGQRLQREGVNSCQKKSAAAPPRITMAGHWWLGLRYTGRPACYLQSGAPCSSAEVAASGILISPLSRRVSVNACYLCITGNSELLAPMMEGREGGSCQTSLLSETCVGRPGSLWKVWSSQQCSQHCMCPGRQGKWVCQRWSTAPFAAPQRGLWARTCFSGYQHWSIDLHSLDSTLWLWILNILFIFSVAWCRFQRQGMVQYFKTVILSGRRKPSKASCSCHLVVIAGKELA